MNEKIFDMKCDFGKFRIVARYGENKVFHHDVWWFYIQTEITSKPLFFKPKTKWHEIDSCWTYKQFKNEDELKEFANKWFLDIVVTPKKLHEQALSI